MQIIRHVVVTNVLIVLVRGRDNMTTVFLLLEA